MSEVDPSTIASVRHVGDGRLAVRFDDGLEGVIDTGFLGDFAKSLRWPTARVGFQGSCVEVKQKASAGGLWTDICSDVFRARVDPKFAEELRQAIDDYYASKE